MHSLDLMQNHLGHTKMNMSGHGTLHHSNHHATGDHSKMHHEHMAHTMMMYFHTGYFETVLFKQWQISSLGELIGSMIGIMILAALYEGLKYYREYLFWRTYNVPRCRRICMSQDKNNAGNNRVIRPKMLSSMHIFQTFLHIIQMVLSYFLMFIFMTFNVWLCFAVALGAGTGYFLFGWKKSEIVEITEHCN